MRYLYVIYALVTFVLLFLTLFPFFLILSLFGSWGRRATWRLIRLWSIVWFFLIGIRTKVFYEAPLNRNEASIVVANHSSYMDTPIIFRGVPFYVRPLAKFELSKIPLFGFLYKQVAVTIDRSSDRSKAQGVKVLKETLAEGSSIIIFPEGTFNESTAPLKDFYDGAFRIAVQTGAPILPVLFLDGKNLWHYSSFWALKPGRNRVVFLKPVEVRPFGNDIQGLKREVHQRMATALRKFQADSAAVNDL